MDLKCEMGSGRGWLWEDFGLDIIFCGGNAVSISWEVFRRLLQTS